MLGLDPLFILGSWQRGGALFGASPPHPRGFWGDRDCLEEGTSQFFWDVPPNPAPGTMASAPGMGVAHRGGEAVTPPRVGGVSTSPVGGTSVGAPQCGHPHTALVKWGEEPHRIMEGLLQLDFDLRAGGVRRATAWGKAGGS